MINVYRYDDYVGPDVVAKDGEPVLMESSVPIPPDTISMPSTFDFIIVFANDVHFF